MVIAPVKSPILLDLETTPPLHNLNLINHSSRYNKKKSVIRFLNTLVSHLKFNITYRRCIKLLKLI